MVHVRKCPCRYGRAYPTTEFHKDGKPQIYCMGWQDPMTDEPLECCANCFDWVGGEQNRKDYEEYRKGSK